VAVFLRVEFDGSILKWILYGLTLKPVHVSFRPCQSPSGQKIMDKDTVIDLVPEPRHLKAGRGWQWYVQGFTLFRRQPGMWIVLALQFLVLALLASVLPAVVAIAYTLVSPVLSAGLFLAAKQCDLGNKVGALDLFAAFKAEIKPLLRIGFINVLAVLLVTVVLSLLGSQSSLADIAPGTLPTPEQMKSLYLHTSLNLILMTPMICAVWFAPALVLFEGYTPLEAMKLSFIGVCRNWQAFLVSGLITIALCVFSAFTLMLGFLVVLPVMMLMQYAAYQEIFEVTPIGIDGASAC
jgi:uncharacterized membrane protein